MNPKYWAWATSLCLALGAVQPATAQPAANKPEKILRYAFPVAETGMDPVQTNDVYSSILNENIFDALYKYDYLARPVKLKPEVADGMPEVSADFRTWTVKLKRGIHFADDPAFGGKKRELVAADVVYSFKRFFDPKSKSPKMSTVAEEKIIGLADLNTQAKATGKFNYDSEIEGLRALDSHTVQFKLGEGRPRFILPMSDVLIMAREVVEKYGDAIMEHPVGTGAFMLQEWKRSSRITLVRNPNFREEYFDGEAAAGDARAQEIAAQMKGKRLPMLDKVVVSIIDEPQPRWLAFLNNEHDYMERLPAAYANTAIPNNKLAPNLAKRGMVMDRTPMADLTYAFFNMDDPVVGGYTPDKVALRRAISLAYDTAEEVRLPRRGQAVAAQGPFMPNTQRYNPALRTPIGTFDRARAVALLDMYGYVDKDGDGWRDLPDGKPLVLEYWTLATADYRELDEIFKKSLDAIGIKVDFKVGKWPEELKAARAGKLQMWGLGLSAGSADSGTVLPYLGDSSRIGQSNFARFKMARYDEIVRKQGAMPDGPEREALQMEALRILSAYMPYKFRSHRIATDLSQPWLLGFKRHPFSHGIFWRYVDIDPGKLPR